jgi:hypothetical protein
MAVSSFPSQFLEPPRRESPKPGATRSDSHVQVGFAGKSASENSGND